MALRLGIVLAGVALVSCSLALSAQDSSTDQIVYTHARGEVVQVAQPTGTPVATPSGPVAVPVKPVATPVSNALTPEQSKALYAPRGPRPGIYRIRALHSGFCLGVLSRSRGFGTWYSNVQQVICSQPGWPEKLITEQRFFVVPHPQIGHTIRSLADVKTGGRQAVSGQLSNCATIEPAPVLGPSAIDFRGCNLPSGASDWTEAGSEDQRFFLMPTGNNTFEVRISLDTGDNYDCWAVRGASMDNLVDVIRWGCNGNGDQRFIFEWLDPIPANLEAPLLTKMNWLPTPDGHRRLTKANGVELPGPSSSYFETIADNGDYCMKRCAELKECKGWTWSAAGFQAQEKPMCHWKTSLGTPVNHGPSALGKVMSGIIRP